MTPQSRHACSAWPTFQFLFLEKRNSSVFHPVLFCVFYFAARPNAHGYSPPSQYTLISVPNVQGVSRGCSCGPGRGSFHLAVVLASPCLPRLGHEWPLLQAQLPDLSHAPHTMPPVPHPPGRCSSRKAPIAQPCGGCGGEGRRAGVVWRAYPWQFGGLVAGAGSGEVRVMGAEPGRGFGTAGLTAFQLCLPLTVDRPQGGQHGGGCPSNTFPSLLCLPFLVTNSSCLLWSLSQLWLCSLGTGT